MPADGSAPVDGINHPFPPPKVWPEGAGQKPNWKELWERPGPAPVGVNVYAPPMQLHYPGRVCKDEGGERAWKRASIWVCAGCRILKRCSISCN